MKKKTYKPAFWFSVTCMFLMTLIFPLMPLAGEMDLAGDGLLLRLSGVWFWAMLLGALGLFLFVNRKRKKQADKSQPKQKPGIIRFFTNPWGKAADIVFFASLAAFLTVLFLSPQSFAVYILLSLTTFSALMHGVFNGVNYQFIKTQQ